MNLIKTFLRFLALLVAQVGNLPYRRLVVGRLPACRPAADYQSATQQTASLRYVAGFLALALLGFSGLFASPARAADDPALKLEYKIKAGYLVNFTKYVEWPAAGFPSTNSPIIIGVMDGTLALPVIQQVISNKFAGDRPIVIRQVTTPGPTNGCHILFVSRTAKTTPGEVRAALGTAATLVVGETELFAERGGMIGFIRADDTLRFTLNLDSVTNTNLKISSQLANVAKLVKTQKVIRP